MRRLTWFMLKHSGGKAHWNDEERPWNSFVQRDTQLGGRQFIFIAHHLSIVSQSVNDRRATAVCMLIILLALLWADTRIEIFCQIECRTDFWYDGGRQLQHRSHACFWRYISDHSSFGKWPISASMHMTCPWTEYKAKVAYQYTLYVYTSIKYRE